jgi:hypothetical protein
LQIKDEVKSVLEFIKYVYDKFGFNHDYELELSTVTMQSCLYFGSIYERAGNFDLYLTVGMEWWHFMVFVCIYSIVNELCGSTDSIGHCV